MKDDKTIDIEDFEEPEEEFPLVGKTIDNLYNITSCIGEGGMCFVYEAVVENLYRLRAKEIISGNMDLDMIGLKPENLGLDEPPEGRITNPSLVERIYAQSEKLAENIKTTFTKDDENAKDTRRIVQRKLITDTHKEFRPALDEDGNVLVAFKVLKRSLGSDKKKIARFHREGKAFKQLSHPNLVKSIDVGSSEIEVLPGKFETAHHYVMECIKPYDFSQHLIDEEGASPLPLRFAIPITKGVLNAFDYLHEKGIVHRDIKPSNIMVEKKSFLEYLAKQGEMDIRVSDLGLARLHFIDFESGSQDMHAQMESHTHSHTVFGTSHYISPEQAVDATNAVPASDIWSMAASLYALLTGTHPFGSNEMSPMQVLSRILQGEPPLPPREIKPDNVPQFIDDQIMTNFSVITIEKDKDGTPRVKENNRIAAKEWRQALDDYETIEKKSYTDDELVEKIKTAKKSEELSLLYIDALNRMERKRINEKEYDYTNVNKRISLLEKAIENTENDLRKRYLQKILNRETKLPKGNIPKEEPEEEIKTKQPGRLKKAALYTLGALTLGGALLFGGIKLKTHLERVDIYQSIRADIQQKAIKELNAGNLETAQKVLEENRQELKRLPRDYMDLEEIFSDFETKIEHAQNQEAYTHAEKIVDEAKKLLRKRDFPKAQTKTDKAKENLEKITLKEFTEQKIELQQKIIQLDKTLSAKKGAIRTYKFVTEEHARLQKEYQALQKDLEDGEPFPSAEKIKQTLTDLNRKKLMLGDIKPDFVEKGEPVKEYSRLEKNLIQLEQATGTLGTKIAQKQMQKINQKINQLPQKYLEENAENAQEKINKRVHSTEALLQIITETYTQDIETLYTQINQAKKEIEHYSQLKKQAEKGNSTARQILELEELIKNPKKYTYVKNGLTNEILKQYTSKTDTYLNGKNMRADIYIQVTLQDIAQKAPKYKEEINTLLEKANPLFKTSWKIQQLNAALDEKPQNKTAKKALKSATERFTQTTKTVKNQFANLNTTLTNYVKDGARVPNPYDFIALGDKYLSRKNKERAIQAYGSGLMLFYMGFPGDSEIIKYTTQKLKQLQK